MPPGSRAGRCVCLIVLPACLDSQAQQVRWDAKNADQIRGRTGLRMLTENYTAAGTSQ